MNIDPRIIEQFNQRAPFKLEDATLLVLAMIGSDSHGTKIEKDDPQSIDDTDFMGIVLPPPSYVFGLKSWEGLNFQFEELDCVFYSFRKFVNLVIKSNPNVLGLLWLNPKHYVVESREWKLLLQNRSSFSSLDAYHSFLGYAHAQLKKMESFDLSTQIEWERVIKLITAAGWTKEQVIKGSALPMPRQSAVLDILCHENHIANWEEDLVDKNLQKARESIKRIHARHFQGYMGEKRKSAVIKYGYDVKNAAHLIRLMKMCVDYLKTGTLEVYRTYDAEYLMCIKRGAYTIEEIKQQAEMLFEEAKIEKENSPLPEKPDVEFIDFLTQKVHLSAYQLRKK